ERGGRHAVQRVELVAGDVEPVVLSPPRQTHRVEQVAAPQPEVVVRALPEAPGRAFGKRVAPTDTQRTAADTSDIAVHELDGALDGVEVRQRIMTLCLLDSHDHELALQRELCELPAPLPAPLHTRLQDGLESTLEALPNDFVGELLERLLDGLPA